MKLRNLFESKLTPAEVREVGKRHSVIEAGDEGGGINGIAMSVFIISDVPRISEDQFIKLRDASFEGMTLAMGVSVLPVHLFGPPYTQNFSEDDWYDHFEETYYSVGSSGVSIETLTWKQFVTTIKEAFPSHDDFSE